MENKRKHLEFIQAIISRMSSNLFFLRGWTITLIGALLALFSKNNDWKINDKNKVSICFFCKKCKECRNQRDCPSSQEKQITGHSVNSPLDKFKMFSFIFHIFLFYHLLNQSIFNLFSNIQSTYHKHHNLYCHLYSTLSLPFLY